MLGGAAGLLVAKWGIGVIRALTPNELPLLGVDHLGVDLRVLLFTLLLSLVTGLLFGMLRPGISRVRTSANHSRTVLVLPAACVAGYGWLWWLVKSRSRPCCSSRPG